MNYLTKSEDILLLAIYHLKGNAYGVTIRKQVKQITGEEMTYGTLYSSLDQLVRKDYVVKTAGEPTPERGGRRKIYYSISTKGFNALKKSQQLTKNLWQDVSEFSIEKTTKG
jgi:DNA-binding PadR family transcriptional regulator